MEPPWGGGTKVYINGPGHMTKMAAMAIYGKNLKKSSSPEPAGRFSQNLVFYGKVKFGNLGFSIEKVKTVDFSETIAACDLLVGRYRQLIDFMKIYEY